MNSFGRENTFLSITADRLKCLWPIILLLILLPALSSNGYCSPKAKTPSLEQKKRAEARVTKGTVKKHIRTRFEESKGYTLVVFPTGTYSSLFILHGGPFSKPRNSQLELRGYVYVNPDAKPYTPPLKVTLSFVNKADRWRYFGTNKINIQVDGKYLDVGRLVYSGTETTLSGIIEIMTLKIDLTKLDQIANSTKVEVQVGKSEFVLKPRLLAFLKEFSSILKDPVRIKSLSKVK